MIPANQPNSKATELMLCGLAEESFGHYRLLSLLGQGGMGQVFRAYDTTTDRIVALKVLPPNAAEDRMFQQRFRREAHTAAGLSDPHVVPIDRFGEIDGRLYVDMRLIEGRDLGVVLKETGGPLHPARAVRLIEQVAEALDAAHSAGLVHRDVKPSNMLVTPRDFVYLIDFGIARALDATRLTSTGAAIGTFAYMSPERFETGEGGPSSDVYALACVLHECLTGRQPFGGSTMQQQIAAHLTKPPPRPSVMAADVPPAFDAVIERGMAKDPDERYQTAMELGDAARAALDEQPRHVPPAPPLEPTEAAPTQRAPARGAPPPEAIQRGLARPAPLSNPSSSPPAMARDVASDRGAPAQSSADALRDRSEQLFTAGRLRVPGLLIMVFAVLGPTFMLYSSADPDEWVGYLVTPLLLLSAVAFGMLARSERPVMGYRPMRAAVVGGVAGALVIFFQPDVVHYYGYYSYSWSVSWEDAVKWGALVSIPILVMGLAIFRTTVRDSDNQSRSNQ